MFYMDMRGFFQLMSYVGSLWIDWDISSMWPM